MIDYRVGELSNDDKAVFEALRDPDYTNFALMQCKYDDIETSVICSINEAQDPSKDYLITPIAIVCNEELRKHLTDPHGDHTNE